MKGTVSKYALALMLLFVSAMGFAQVTQRERPKEWDLLVPGGRYVDRFLPMEGNVVSSDVWGCKDVLPRYVDNGIEDPRISYWGGNILRGKDGKYHMFVCGWKENSPRGHMFWSKSTVFHTVSDTPHGPYRMVTSIGKGHNPEAYYTEDGRILIYTIDGFYTADSPEGPWFFGKFNFDDRDRPIIEGLSNLTFARREDGSRIMICRGGGVWISRDGLWDWHQISDKRVYPDVKGEFEDPVIWKDSVQYHLIVNDWLGRIAFYERSKDGLHWVVEPGEAYVPGIAVHKDGTKENWFKYERPKVLQDEYGRVEQMNFAVIDTIKWEDQPNDHHSSKNICIPMNKGLLMSILNTEKITDKTKTIELLVRSEKGFDAASGLDIASLRFGSFKEVNYGRGAKVKKSRPCPEGIILVFENKNTGIDDEEFAPKLIGKDTKGQMVYGYTRMPGVDYRPALVSARKPKLSKDGKKITVVVENYGMSESTPYYIKITGGNGFSSESRTGRIEAYGREEIIFDAPDPINEDETKLMKVELVPEEG